MEDNWRPLSQLARSTALMLCLTGGARAETDVAEMHVVAMSLQGVFAWFSQETGLAVVAPEGLTARVTDVRLRADTAMFTGWLARDYGLDHYVIGATLHLAPASESVRQMLPLDGVSLSDLVEAINFLDAHAAAALLAGNQEGSAVLVSGPPAYVALVGAVLDDLRAARALRARIVMNRGGIVTVDDMDARRLIVSIPPAPPAPPEAPPVQN